MSHMMIDQFSILSSIMEKIPVTSLDSLKQEFNKYEDDLNLETFLKVFMKYISVTLDDKLVIVTELIDFFHQIDIYGKNKLSWSDFVIAIIEQIKCQESFKIDEKLKLTHDIEISTKNINNGISYSKFFIDINKIFATIDNEIFIIGIDKLNSKNISIEASIMLNYKQIDQFDDEKKVSNYQPNSTRIPISMKAKLMIIDMCMLVSKDVIFVLRNDLMFEYLKIASRIKFTSDTIQSIGIHKTKNSYTKLCTRDLLEMPKRLFAVSADNFFDYWDIEFKNAERIELVNKTTIQDHSDFIRDILVIETLLHKLLVTCSLDRCVILYNLGTMERMVRHRRHEAGVESLAFDGSAILLSGSFDSIVFGWDLTTKFAPPIFKLCAYQGIISKIICLPDVNRCCTLDSTGKITFWDSSRYTLNENLNREIDSYFVLKDKILAIDTIKNKDDHIICSFGRRGHLLQITHSIDTLSPIKLTLYSTVLQLVISIHHRDIIFWNIVNGNIQHQLLDIVPNNGCEILCSTLDVLERKLITGDSFGYINMYNCLTGSSLGVLSKFSGPVRFIIYTPEDLIIAVFGRNCLVIIDCDKKTSKLDESFPKQINSVLRRLHLPKDVDVSSIKYYFELSLIALSCFNGSILLIDFEYLDIIRYISKAQLYHHIDCMIFLKPYPLLLIGDSHMEFSIIPVGPGLKSHGDYIWHFSGMPHVNKFTLSQDMEVPKAKGEDVLSMIIKDFETANLFLHSNRELRALVWKPELNLNLNNQTSKISEYLENQMDLFCGYDDGKVARISLSMILNIIKVTPIAFEESIIQNKTYNPRRMNEVFISDELNSRSGKSLQVILEERCQLESLWCAHTSFINSLALMDNNCLLSSSDDINIKLWDLNGNSLALLSAKKESRQWKIPIDNFKRYQDRLLIANSYIQDLNIQMPLNSKESSSNIKEKQTSINAIIDEVTIQLKEHRIDSISNALGQMAGKIAMPSSKRELATRELLNKRQQLKKQLNKMFSSHNNKINKKKSHDPLSLLLQEDVLPTQNHEKITSIPRSQYDIELDMIEVKNPSNFDVTSWNHTKLLYPNYCNEVERIELNLAESKYNNMREHVDSISLESHSQLNHQNTIKTSKESSLMNNDVIFPKITTNAIVRVDNSRIFNYKKEPQLCDLNDMIHESILLKREKRNELIVSFDKSIQNSCHQTTLKLKTIKKANSKLSRKINRELKSIHSLL